MSTASTISALRTRWTDAWPAALAAWSRFTKLAGPRWCLTEGEEKKESLRGSFAMIRLVDHAVVISLRQVEELGLESFATEILAHEIGHHVLAPGDLRDHARLLARIRTNLPTREQHAGMVANLFTDLLINDRLQRAAGLNMIGVYQVLRKGGRCTPVWSLYMRIYEVLWGLQAGTLNAPPRDANILSDAALGAKVIRVYAHDWLKGAGRFAALLLPYLIAIPEAETLKGVFGRWADTEDAGSGGELPDGLSEMEEGEGEVLHPAEDPNITGESPEDDQPGGLGRELVGGRKHQYRSPEQYTELLAGMGVKIPVKDMVIRYYRERAIPYRIRFPRRSSPVASDPYPEGLDTWEPGDSVAEIDWTATLNNGPHVIPGVTTVRRLEGASPGIQPQKAPLDLYIGIDCSGSMSNPAVTLSYPVLAATVITVSALRAGARIMACLSGEEPGSHCETDGFLRDEHDILNVLTNYLGTGYSFGIQRLKTAFLDQPAPLRPVHILVVSDHDMFYMLDSHAKGWDIAEAAVQKAGGGGTFVLQVDPRAARAGIDHMRKIGWDVFTVRDQDELVTFARAFSQRNYEQI